MQCTTQQNNTGLVSQTGLSLSSIRIFK